MRNSERCALMIAMAAITAIGCKSDPMVSIICAVIAAIILGFLVLSEIQAVIRIRNAAKRSIPKAMVLIDSINDCQMFARQLHRESQWRFISGGVMDAETET